MKPTRNSFSPFVAAAIAMMFVVAQAQAVEPTFDCTKTDSDVEDAICASSELAELDVELARLYRLALKGPHLGNREAELMESQRSWIRSRNECWKSSLGLETCTANSYAFRIAELREGYSDARAEPGASDGPFAYRCDGLDALVGATFVKTSTPMVVLSWFDRSMVLPLVHSGSGAKYASDIWDGKPSLFWTKGEEAIFAEPGGAEMTCLVTPIG